MFALHRFSAAEVLPQKTERPEQFSLDEYLRSGALGFGFGAGQDDGAPRQVLLRFRRPAAHSVLECPLSEDQQVLIEDEDFLTLSATVPLTAQLVWWLRGFGQSVQVLQPDVLAERVGGNQRQCRRLDAGVDRSGAEPCLSGGGIADQRLLRRPSPRQ